MSCWKFISRNLKKISFWIIKIRIQISFFFVRKKNCHLFAKYFSLQISSKKFGFSFRVCEVIYEQSGEWDQVFLCYLQDPLRKPQVFSFLRNILLLYKNMKDVNPVLDRICDKIEELLELDVVTTSSIVTSHLIDRLSDLLKNVSNEKLQLSLLKSVLYHRTKWVHADAVDISINFSDL